MDFTFKEIWQDPVGSKVIGGLIVAILIFIASWLRARIFKKKNIYPTKEELIIESLKSKEFPIGRTTSGIITDTGLNRDSINEVLNKLENEGIVKQKKGSKKLWSLTIKGKKKK